MLNANEKRIIANDRSYRIEEFTLGGRIFKLMTVKKMAGKRSVIHCYPNGDVQWEQIYPLGIHPVSIVMHICSPRFLEKGKICILLIRGRPSCITGLDEGLIRSAHVPCGEGAVYVMSKRAYSGFLKAVKAEGESADR